MTQARFDELSSLVKTRYTTALGYIANLKTQRELKKAIEEEAEVPGFEDKPMKFGQFANKEFVVMMTDIRRSTDLIHQPNGLVNMFLIFYVYAAVVANIVDRYSGTSTEFLGDGVLNLFDTDAGRPEALRNSVLAANDIMYARTSILNPFFAMNGLPTINLGIGIDYGVTIVTRFGFSTDNDLKAFGTCIYDVSKLSKGLNEIIVSASANAAWPSLPQGTLEFSQTYSKDGKIAYKVLRV